MADTGLGSPAQAQCRDMERYQFTFYGLFTAGAYTFASAILVILLESVNIPLSGY